MKYVLDKSLVTGNPMIDQQHTDLLGMVFDMTHKDQAVPEKEEFIETLSFMIKYARMHFEAEENLMEDTGYGALAAHRLEHDYFRKELQRIRAEASEMGFSSGIAMALHMLMVDQLCAHIKSTDRKLATALTTVS